MEFEIGTIVVPKILTLFGGRKMKKLLMMLLLAIFSFAAVEEAQAEKWFPPSIPVKLKVIRFAQIISADEIILGKLDGNNFEGQTILNLCNNCPLRVAARIKSSGVRLADNYYCSLQDSLSGGTGWGTKVSIITGIHLFDSPGEILLGVRLENVNMGKVAYQNDLLDVAKVTITLSSR